MALLEQLVSRVLSLNLISFPENAARRAASESRAEVFFLKKNRSTSLFPQRSAFCFLPLCFPIVVFHLLANNASITAQLKCTVFWGPISPVRRIFTNHKCTPIYERSA